MTTTAEIFIRPSIVPNAEPSMSEMLIEAENRGFGYRQCSAFLDGWYLAKGLRKRISMKFESITNEGKAWFQEEVTRRDMDNWCLLGIEVLELEKPERASPVTTLKGYRMVDNRSVMICTAQFDTWDAAVLFANTKFSGGIASGRIKLVTA